MKIVGDCGIKVFLFNEKVFTEYTKLFFAGRRAKKKRRGEIFRSDRIAAKGVSKKKNEKKEICFETFRIFILFLF